jgi:pimeloyl-ACP methyl ester carboxylesterase
VELTYNGIHYTKVGQGPHLCFLHGFCEDQSIWEPVITLLQENHTCIAIDLPGFGKSKHTRFKSLPEVAVQVNQLLTHGNTSNCIVFGHSMGGYLVAEYIHQFAEQINGAAFIHSTCRADSDEKKEKRAKTIDFIAKNGSSLFFPIFIEELVTEQNFEALKTKLFALASATPDQSIIDGHAAMMNREDRLSSVSQFNKPILFLKGEKDKHYGPFDTSFEAAQCQLAQISEIKNVAHLSMFEDSAACAAAIKEFLAFAKNLKL